jgi:hypothetical protein
MIELAVALLVVPFVFAVFFWVRRGARAYRPSGGGCLVVDMSLIGVLDPDVSQFAKMLEGLERRPAGEKINWLEDDFVPRESGQPTP